MAGTGRTPNYLFQNAETVVKTVTPFSFFSQKYNCTVVQIKQPMFAFSLPLPSCGCVNNDCRTAAVYCSGIRRRLGWKDPCTQFASHLLPTISIMCGVSMPDQQKIIGVILVLLKNDLFCHLGVIRMQYCCIPYI